MAPARSRPARGDERRGFGGGSVLGGGGGEPTTTRKTDDATPRRLDARRDPRFGEAVDDPRGGARWRRPGRSRAEPPRACFDESRRREDEARADGREILSYTFVDVSQSILLDVSQSLLPAVGHPPLAPHSTRRSWVTVYSPWKYASRFFASHRSLPGNPAANASGASELAVPPSPPRVATVAACVASSAPVTRGRPFARRAARSSARAVRRDARRDSFRRVRRDAPVESRVLRPRPRPSPGSSTAFHWRCPKKRRPTKRTAKNGYPKQPHQTPPQK